MIGLLGAEIERRYRTPEFIPARLNVDMYHLPNLSSVEVVTRVIRDVHLIKVFETEYIYGEGVSGAALRA